MRGRVHVPIRRSTTVAAAGLLLLSVMPGTVQAVPTDIVELPACTDEVTGGVNEGVNDGVNDRAGGEMVRPWEVVLDDDGSVSEHRFTLRRGGHELDLRTGPRGFSVSLGEGRLLVGEHLPDGTRLDMVDVGRGCLRWSRTLDHLLYPEGEAAPGRTLRLSVHEATTRAYRGTLEVDRETGDSGGLIDGECIDSCLPNDGGLDPAALLPAGAPRPTPAFAAGGWPQDKLLHYRWQSGAAPPEWAKAPLTSGADDARSTSAARSPRFALHSEAISTVGYTGNVPGFCSLAGIACAGRDMPRSWGVWIRPHGSDYAWGELHWCQKTSASTGCFDLRRVFLHELGHIIGLNHPSSAGFNLAADDSVMQGITPSRPQPGASQHAFGRCDVATLQELYDTLDNKTLISTCNNVATTLTLSSSAASIKRGAAVTLTAQLLVGSDSAYRRLSGNPLNGRSVQLKYRRAGTSNAWSTAWMRSTYSSGRYELSIAPNATWEFKAVFPTPSDEGLRYSASGVIKVKVSA